MNRLMRGRKHFTDGYIKIQKNVSMSGLLPTCLLKSVGPQKISKIFRLFPSGLYKCMVKKKVTLYLRFSTLLG